MQAGLRPPQASAGRSSQAGPAQFPPPPPPPGAEPSQRLRERGSGSVPPRGGQPAPSRLRAPGGASQAHSPRSGPPAALARSLAGCPSRRRKCGPRRQTAPRGRSRNVAGATLYGAGPTGKKPFVSSCLFPLPAARRASRGSARPVAGSLCVRAVVSGAG